MTAVAPDGRKLLRVEARNAAVPIEKKPEWIKIRARMGPQYSELKNLVRGEGLHTVCEEAGCPNIFECWEDREATFLIGGATCSRNCSFCQIDSGKPMPLDRDVECLAIDEIQLAADHERGHIFTDRLLHARGIDETLLLGSDAARGLIKRLVPRAEFLQRDRFSTLTYAGMRKQFGKAIGGFQLIQKNLADIQTAITTSRLLCYYALDAIDRGERANGSSAMAKRYATTACHDAISLAMQVHGAMGISREAKIEGLYRDVRMLPIPDATNEILALIQGREITGLDAFRS